MNDQWLLARAPEHGWPESDDFRKALAPAPEPEEGQALTQTLYLSMDPYQWGRRRSGIEQPGDVCHGRTVSQVIASRHAEFREGDIIFNTNGWQTYGLVGAGIDVFRYMFPRRIDPALAPVSTAVGVLGMLGLTAWSGMKVQCDPQPGETVVVSAASGGVGQVAGQIARLCGARVVGIAGAQEKCDFVTSGLGLDDCVSHLSPDLPAALAERCPDGIDVYFENVGGSVFAAVAPLFNMGARISLCGMISQYGNDAGVDSRGLWEQTGMPYLTDKQVTVHDLFVGNYVESQQDAFLDQMGAWVKEGVVRYKENLFEGLDRAPEAFMAMLRGDNFGKTLVSVAEDPTLTDTLRERRAGSNVLSGRR